MTATSLRWTRSSPRTGGVLYAANSIAGFEAKDALLRFSQLATGREPDKKSAGGHKGVVGAARALDPIPRRVPGEGYLLPR